MLRFWEGVGRVWTRPFTWSEKSPRSELNWFLLGNFIFGFMAGFAIAIIGKISGVAEETTQIRVLIFSVLFGLIAFLPFLGVMVRRCHDLDWSGAWCLLLLLFPINYIFTLVLMCKASKHPHDDVVSGDSELLTDDRAYSEDSQQHALPSFSQHLVDAEETEKQTMLSENVSEYASDVSDDYSDDEEEASTEAFPQKERIKIVTRLGLVFLGVLIATVVGVFVQKVFHAAGSPSTGNLILNLLLLVVVPYSLYKLVKATAELCDSHQISKIWAILLFVPILNALFLGLLVLPDEQFDKILR